MREKQQCDRTTMPQLITSIMDLGASHKPVRLKGKKKKGDITSALFKWVLCKWQFCGCNCKVSIKTVPEEVKHSQNEYNEKAIIKGSAFQPLKGHHLCNFDETWWF